MASVIVRKSDGSTLLLNRQYPLCFVAAASQSQTLLSQDELAVSVESAEPIDFAIGDVVDLFGRTYTLNRLPRADKNSRDHFVYELTFEGPQYQLLRILFLDIDKTGVATGPDFPITATLKELAAVLQTNINRVLPGWALGEVPDTEPKSLSFSNQNCLAALQTLCKEFGTEFDLVRQGGTGNYTLHFRTVGSVLAQTFRFGQGMGLYTLSRAPKADQELITRLYAYGGNRNIPANYRGFSARLKLPGTLDYVEAPASVAAFGLHEAAKTWDDIFPKRTGTITAVGANSLSFVDTSMDFDLNAITTPASGNTPAVYTYLQPGISAKIQVQSGGLAGYGFEVNSYDHATKTFVINKVKADGGLEVPGVAPFQLAVGDTYVLLDILMPTAYVDAAELKLKNEALAYLAANGLPPVNYTLSIDEAYLLSRTTENVTTDFFALGDELTVIDPDLAINKATRIIALKRDVLSPYRYELTLADSYEVTVLDKLLDATSKVEAVVRVNRLADSRMAQMRWKNQEELLASIFSTDGYLNADAIRPLSVTTAMLSVGTRSGQLTLSSVIRANYNGNPNNVQVDAGTLTHYGITDGILTWNLPARSYTLSTSGPHYIYAKCHKSNYTDGAVILSTQQIKVDEDASYYHFLLGLLHSVDANLGMRWISMEYGATAINGRFITTGRIMSADGQTWFDLDTGEIRGNITFSGNDGGNATVDQLEQELLYFRNVTIPNLRKSLSGKVVSYFQDADPNSWASGDRINHRGDAWYKTSTKQLFNYDDLTNSWVENSDKTAVAAYEIASKAKDTADGKRRNFIVQPFPPYDVGDLWTDGVDLRKCITAKVEGQPYNPLDWNKATAYDNTKTTIDGGVVTSGRIQLAGDGQTVVAGISGQGTADDSVRVWAGTTYENRNFAPFRITQEGRVYARRLIAMLSSNNVEQAGICGANNSGDGTVRFFAGSTYDNRNSAPFQVHADGRVVMSTGKVGKLDLVDGGLSAVNGDSFVQIDINKAETGLIAGTTNLKSINKQANAIYNIALYLEAMAGSVASYALYAPKGKSMFNEALLNGRATRHFAWTGPGTRTISVNVLLSDFITLMPAAGRIDLQFTTSGIGDLTNGKEVTIVNLNDANSLCFLKNVVNGEAETQISGGEVLTVVYQFGYWLTKSRFDNNLNGAGMTIPLIDQ